MQVIQQFRDDELEHLETGEEHNARKVRGREGERDRQTDRQTGREGGREVEVEGWIAIQYLDVGVQVG